MATLLLESPNALRLQPTKTSRSFIESFSASVAICRKKGWWSGDFLELFKENFIYFPILTTWFITDSHYSVAFTIAFTTLSSDHDSQVLNHPTNLSTKDLNVSRVLPHIHSAPLPCPCCLLFLKNLCVPYSAEILSHLSYSYAALALHLHTEIHLLLFASQTVCICAQTLEANLLLTCLILPEGSLAPVTLSHVFIAPYIILPLLNCKLSSPSSDTPGLKPVGKDHMCGYFGYSRAPQMESTCV